MLHQLVSPRSWSYIYIYVTKARTDSPGVGELALRDGLWVKCRAQTQRWSPASAKTQGRVKGSKPRFNNS